MSSALDIIDKDMVWLRTIINLFAVPLEVVSNVKDHSTAAVMSDSFLPKQVISLRVPVMSDIP